MSEIETLTEKINQYLKDNKLNPLENIPYDFILLYKESLKSVWQNRNFKSREKYSFEIGKYLSKYLNIQKITEIYKESSNDLDKKFPPLFDLIDMYENIIDDYNIFMKEFLDTQNINMEILSGCLKKILLIIENDKNKLISYISQNTEDYNYQLNHPVNSTIIALIGAIDLKFLSDEINDLGISGLLHDIGMTKIPDNVLNKKEKLTDEEYNLIKTHPVISLRFLENQNKFSKEILDAVVQHHEHIDGNGYPQKLKGDKISKYAKLLSIADTFEAQISYRAFRSPITGHSAIKEVLKQIKMKFDPVYLESYLSVFSIYPPGTLVQMNNNSIGSVFSVNPYYPLKPQIKIIIDEFGDKTSKEIIKDLIKEQDLFIIRVLNNEEFIK